MLKNILNLEGAKKMTANEQKQINGAGPGRVLCSPDSTVFCVFPKKCAVGAGGWYCA